MLYSSLESAKHACNHKASCSDFQAPGSATSSLIQDRRQLSSSCCCPTAWSASNAEVFRCIKSSKEMHCISLHLNHPAAQLYASWRAIMRVHLIEDGTHTHSSLAVQGSHVHSTKQSDIRCSQKLQLLLLVKTEHDSKAPASDLVHLSVSYCPAVPVCS